LADEKPFLVARWEGGAGFTTLTVVYPEDAVTHLHKEVRYTLGEKEITEQVGIYPKTLDRYGAQDVYAWSENKGNALSTRKVTLAEMRAATGAMLVLFDEKDGLGRSFGYVQLAGIGSDFFSDLAKKYPKDEPVLAKAEEPKKVGIEEKSPPKEQAKDYVSIFNKLVTDPKWVSLLKKVKSRLAEVNMIEKIEKDFGLTSPKVEENLPGAAHMLYSSLLMVEDAGFNGKLRPLKPMSDEKKEHINQIFAKSLELDTHLSANSCGALVMFMMDDNAVGALGSHNHYTRNHFIMEQLADLTKKYKKDHAQEMNKPEVQHMLGELDEIKQLYQQVYDEPNKKKQPERKAKTR
jgi:hypothetical protein